MRDPLNRYKIFVMMADVMNGWTNCNLAFVSIQECTTTVRISNHSKYTFFSVCHRTLNGYAQIQVHKKLYNALKHIKSIKCRAYKINLLKHWEYTVLNAEQLKLFYLFIFIKMKIGHKQDLHAFNSWNCLFVIYQGKWLYFDWTRFDLKWLNSLIWIIS